MTAAPPANRTRSLPAPPPHLAAVRRHADLGPELEGLELVNRNERLQPLPATFVNRLRRLLTSDLLTHYPRTDQLYERLADHLGLPTSRLLLTLGSDAAVKALYQVYVRPGDPVAFLDPSYAMYGVYAQIFGAQAHRAPVHRDLLPDLGALHEAMSKGARIVFLANPNQPTGGVLPRSDIEALLERASDVGALVVVDEAYYPFSGTTVRPLLDRHPNLVMLRTFSKAAGLAGLRIGYAAGDEDVIQNLSKVRSVYDINAVAVVAAQLVLEHPQIMANYVKAVDAGRATLERRARALGLEPLPGRTNFLLLRVAHKVAPASLLDDLKREGFLARGPFPAPIDDCIRVTLGPPKLMNEFSDALARALRPAKPRGWSR